MTTTRTKAGAIATAAVVALTLTLSTAVPVAAHTTTDRVTDGRYKALTRTEQKAVLAGGGSLCVAGLVFGVGTIVATAGAAPAGWAAAVAWTGELGSFGVNVLGCLADVQNNRAPRQVSCNSLLRAPNATQLIFKYCDFWNATGYPYAYGWAYVYRTWGSGVAYYQFHLRGRA